MFVIFGFGKRTRKVVGVVGSRTCNYCNTYAEWQLCILRTWFTLFFIPIIPYGKSYNISCPKCKSYRELTKEEFEAVKNQIGSNLQPVDISDAVKYPGKTATQIEYLKHMEELEKKPV